MGIIDNILKPDDMKLKMANTKFSKNINVFRRFLLEIILILFYLKF